MTSQSDMTETFTVSLNVNGMPDCTCKVWKTQFMPCKHIFAVLHHIYSMDWYKLPSEYTNSPWCTIDSDSQLYTASSEQPADDMEEAESYVAPEDNSANQDGGNEAESSVHDNFMNQHEARAPSISSITEVTDILKTLSEQAYQLTELKDIQQLKDQLQGKSQKTSCHLFSEYHPNIEVVVFEILCQTRK